MTSRAKVAVLISGAGSNMAALLYASRVGAPYEIVLVASNDPHAGGLSLAEAEGIPTFALSHKGMKRAEHDAAMDEAIRKSGAEYVALAGYMRVLSDEMVARWEGRMLNIHPSLLPKYKGLDPHARALEAGDEAVGASVHLVTSELDGGEVLGQAEVMVMGGDTPETLAHRVKLAEHQLYPRVLGDYVSRGNDPQWLLRRLTRMALARFQDRGQKRQVLRPFRRSPPRRRANRATRQDQRAGRTGRSGRTRPRGILPPRLLPRKRLGRHRAQPPGLRLGPGAALARTLMA